MSAVNRPRAVFSVSITEEEYLRAARVASRNGGRLRVVWTGFVLCAALTLTVAGALAAYPWAALWLCAVGGTIALVTLCLMRYAFLRTAARDYRVFSAVFSTTEVTLWEDTLEYSGTSCCRKEAYALFSRLVENETQFLLLRDDGTFLLLPKQAFPTDGHAADFLRVTFARKYRRTRG